MGALVPNGLLQASTDMEDVRNWWNEVPDANIGLRTGEAFDVLDIDGANGRRSMVSFDYHHTGPVASTGKGFHLLFAVTGARNAANKLPGLDFRGQNGYIVASPSIHPSGARYEWIRDGELPEPTDWLLQLITPARKPIDPNAPHYDVNPIVATFIQLFGAIRTLRPVGERAITLCLFHEEDTPSMVLYPATDSFFCFGCQAWGDTANLTNFALTGELR